MMSIRATIPGVRYARNKTRGNLSAPSEWTQTVIRHTADLPKIREACLLRITYLLPRANVPKDYPFGTDLDNLNKRFLDEHRGANGGAMIAVCAHAVKH